MAIRGGSAEFTRSACRWQDGQSNSPRMLSIIYRKGRTIAAGRWFVSLLVDDSTVEALPVVEKTVGIDAGITLLIATSDGEKIANPKIQVVGAEKLPYFQSGGVDKKLTDH